MLCFLVAALRPTRLRTRHSDCVILSAHKLLDLPNFNFLCQEGGLHKHFIYFTDNNLYARYNRGIRCVHPLHRIRQNRD